jgi:16S rRNA processing protein RimM
MINRGELVQIGQFRKSHGTQGEIAFSFINDSFATSKRSFLVCEIDGIFVPFHIENYRFISNSLAYIRLKTIDSDLKTRSLIGKDVFFPKKYIKKSVGSDDFTYDYFIGFTLIDEQLGEIGLIIDVDTTTLNTLFIVEKGKEEILVPAVEEIIIRINENRKEIIVALPEGLLEQQ